MFGSSIARYYDINTTKGILGLSLFSSFSNDNITVTDIKDGARGKSGGGNGQSLPEDSSLIVTPSSVQRDTMRDQDDSLAVSDATPEHMNTAAPQSTGIHTGFALGNCSKSLN